MSARDGWATHRRLAATSAPTATRDARQQHAPQLIGRRRPRHRAAWPYRKLSEMVTWGSAGHPAGRQERERRDEIVGIRERHRETGQAGPPPCTT